MQFPNLDFTLKYIVANRNSNAYKLLLYNYYYMMLDNH